MAKLSKSDCEFIAKELEEAGFPWKAEYIRRFGYDLDPSFWYNSKGSESFYKKCVIENHAWDWYHDTPPNEADILY